MNVPEIYGIFLICFLSGVAERLARAADEVEKNGKRKA